MTQTIPEAIDQLLLAANTLEHEVRRLQDENRKLKADNKNRKKLSPREVELLRSMLASGLKQAEVAVSFNLNPATVSRIARNQYHRRR